MRISLGAVFGFLFRESADLFRQPTLVVLTVLGPFLLLLAFGAGYRDERLVLHTLFVGPEGSSYEELLAQNRDRFGEFISVAGYSTDLDAARDRLQEGEVDAVIVFPTNPLGDILGGTSSEVTVLHDELNPIQEVAIGFAVQIATDRVNQAMVEELFTIAQQQAQPVSATLAALEQLRQELRTGGPEQQAVLDELTDAVDQLQGQVEVLDAFGARYGTGTTPEMSELARELAAATQALEAVQREGLTGADLEQLDTRLERLQDVAALVAEVDPSVMARPFVSDTESLSTVNIDATEFFGASAVVLLLQHLAMSLASLTFVRDRAMGLLELVRVGPIGAGEALVGKLVAFLFVGGVVAAALLVAAHRFLEVPMLGDVWWLAVVILLLLLASIGIGFVLSLLARSDTQAVQYAMLVLLATLFFSGFFIDHERFKPVVSAAARLLPLTSAINGIQDVMLRGRAPELVDLAVLAVLAAAGLVSSRYLLRRELRTA